MTRKILSFITLMGLALYGCAAIQPEKMDTPARLAQFPAAGLALQQPVTIYWNGYQVPYIHAKSDADLFYSLGLVNAHLRLVQMTLMKHLAYGRLSELAGPFTRDIDQLIRTINFTKTADENLALLTPDTRQLLEKFIQGINDYMALTQRRPPEYALLGMKDERFTLRDLMVMGRLAGADPNWLAYAALLKARTDKNWEQIWDDALTSGAKTQVFSTDRAALLSQLIHMHSKTGSNSMAISAQKSVTGAPILAGDPHVGMSQPNLWLIVGLNSPTFNAVGLMIPGLPFIGLGRNPHIAWGGTHMRAGSSELYDLNKLKNPVVTERKERIKSRFWFDKEVTIRESDLGPILSDRPLMDPATGETVAFHWVGHQPSNEFAALLAANRADSKEAFRNAFSTYAVSGQNYLFATKTEIGYVAAVRLPIRQYRFPDDLVLDPSDPKNLWQDFENALELPWIINPENGFIASANNQPYPYKTRFGFFYSFPDRLIRLNEMLTRDDSVSFQDIVRLQTDTYSKTAHRLAGEWQTLLKKAGYQSMAGELGRWDGFYDADSRGALVFETITFYFWQMAVDAGVISDTMAFKDWNYIGHHFSRDLEKALEADPDALKDAIEKIDAHLDTYRVWGDVHRLKIQHPLGNAPLIGRFFQYADFPVSGSRSTLMKSNHGLEIAPHHVTYGSQSRHIFLMDDVNENYFVLLGGQDEWLGSENYMDQVKLWHERKFLRMPLELDEIKKTFHFQTLLQPE